MKMRILSSFMLYVLGSYFVPNTFAQETLSPEAAKSFLDFYFDGQGKGVVLADIQACLDVVEHVCVNPTDTSMLMLGTTYKIWMAFVVPEGDTVETIKVHFIKDGVIKASSDMSVRGSIRYRLARTFAPTEPGAWEIRVVNERNVEIENVGSLHVVVGG